MVRDETSGAGVVRDTGTVTKRRDRGRLAGRRVASSRRAAAPSPARTPVRPGRISPFRTVPENIARPPYAPDAPALVPAVPPDELPERMRVAGRAAREVLLEI